MTARVTPWFPASVKPVRVGCYELAYADGGKLPFPFHYWDGKKWICLAEKSPSHITNQMIVAARSLSGIGLYTRDCPWRGLASDPEVSK